MIGCFVLWKCFVACLFFESSQQPTWPQVRHRRRCTQVSPIFRHSSQPSPRGSPVLTRPRWPHFFISAQVFLVELDLDVCEALALVRVELALLEQLVLLAY